MTAAVARISQGDRTGDASGNGDVGGVDSHQQMQNLQFKVVAEIKDGERVSLRCRLGNTAFKQFPMQPEPTPSPSTGHTQWVSDPVPFPVDQNITYYYRIAGNGRLVDSLPHTQTVQRDAEGAVKPIKDGAFRYRKEQSQQRRHNLDQSQRPSTGKVADSPVSAAPNQQQHCKELADGGSRAPVLGARQRSPAARASAPRASAPRASAPGATPTPATAPAPTAPAGQQVSERFEAEFTRFAGRLEEDFAKLRTEAITRENIGELLTAYMRREEHRTRAAEADARTTFLEKTIQSQQVETDELKGQAKDLRLDVGQLQTWREQSVPKQAEMERRLQEQAQNIRDLRAEVGQLKGWRQQSEPKLAEMQTLLQEEQAHGKQVDSVMESQQSELTDCRSSLQGMQEEAQGSGDRLKTLGEQIDNEAARLAGLVGKVEEGLREAQQEMSRGLQDEAAAWKAWQEQSLQVQGEMQTSLQEGQARTKRLDNLVARLETGQQTASSALATLSEDLQRLQELQALQEKGLQRKSATLAKLGEDLQGLQGLQKEGQQENSAALAKLNEEMDERVKTLNEQLQRQGDEVGSEAARLAGLVGQLEEGLQRAQEDHSVSASQLSSLQAKLLQQQQQVEEGASETSRLATSLKGLHDNRQEIRSLRNEVGDLHDGLGDVRDQMQALSKGPAATGVTDIGVSTGTPSTPPQSDDASVASTPKGQGQPDHTPTATATATATAPQARKEKEAPHVTAAPVTATRPTPTPTPTSGAAAHRDAAAAARPPRQSGGPASSSDEVTFTFGKHPDDEASRQITLDVEQQIVDALRNSATGPEKRKLVKNLKLQLHPDKGGTNEAFQWFEEWRQHHYTWFLGEGLEQP